MAGEEKGNKEIEFFGIVYKSLNTRDPCPV